MHAKPISPLEHYLARVHLLPDDIHFLLDVYECKLVVNVNILLLQPSNILGSPWKISKI